MKILLLEDDQTLGEILSERLAQEGYTVKWVSSIAQATELLQKDPHWDLALLDVGLPDGTSFDLVSKFQNKNTPFIFLTARADAETRLQGYELGAHEYIPKPFHLKELLLRLKRVLKQDSNQEIYATQNCEIKVAELTVINKIENVKTTLTNSEMKLLVLLYTESPKVVHRDQVMDVVWGLEKEPSQRTIDNMIVKLRMALGTDGSYLKTVRGVGYQFQKEV